MNKKVKKVLLIVLVSVLILSVREFFFWRNNKITPGKNWSDDPQYGEYYSSVSRTQHVSVVYDRETDSAKVSIRYMAFPGFGRYAYFEWNVPVDPDTADFSSEKFWLDIIKTAKYRRIIPDEIKPLIRPLSLR